MKHNVKFVKRDIIGTQVMVATGSAEQELWANESDSVNEIK